MVAAPVPSNGDAVEGGDQAEAPAAQKVEKKKRERAQPVPVESSEGGEEGRPKRERKQTEVFKAVEPAKKEKEMIVPGSGILLADYGYFCRGTEISLLNSRVLDLSFTLSTYTYFLNVKRIGKIAR